MQETICDKILAPKLHDNMNIKCTMYFKDNLNKGQDVDSLIIFLYRLNDEIFLIYQLKYIKNKFHFSFQCGY